MLFQFNHFNAHKKRELLCMEQCNFIYKLINKIFICNKDTTFISKFDN